MSLEIWSLPTLFTALTLCILIAGATADGSSNPLDFKTNECFLTEPVYQHKFDFSGLRSDFGHIAKSDQGHIFEYNICGSLTRKCDGKSNTSACLRKGDKEFVLGTKHELTYQNGKMYFTFSNGSKCNDKTDYQLHVFVSCDYTLDAIQSHVTSYVNDACSFYINLETPLACLPEPDEVKANSCTATDPDNGHVYDLLPLSDFNYRTTDRNGSAFVINVCKPVLYGEGAMCPPGSSVCFLNISSKDYKQKFYNYGSVQPNPVYENKKLLIRHSSNTVCNATSNYTSTINFSCDRELVNGHPEMIGLHGCNYEFSFPTPLACNDLTPCTAYTHRNKVFDLRTLMDKKYKLLAPNDTSLEYVFGICSAGGAPCMENDGACSNSQNQASSLGVTNNRLRISQNGSPYLLYENGATCKPANAGQPAVFWSTRIEFICANNTNSKDNGSGDGSSKNTLGPKVVENSNCTLLIHYQTPLACNEQIKCTAKYFVEHFEESIGLDILDLTPLISTSSNYEAKIDEALINSKLVSKSTKFHLNVCRPLASVYGWGCPGGSAACMGEVTSPSSPAENELSLGSPLASLVALNRTSAQLSYLHGSDCPADKNSQLSSSIVFYCDMRAGRGTPILRSIADCHYEFTWATNVLCPPHLCTFNAESCEIVNEEINMKHSLKKAPYTDNGKIQIHKEKNNITLDLCGPYNKPVTDYSQGLINMFFSNKGPCPMDSNVDVQMRLICSNETKSEVSFNDNNDCNILYVQRTPDICKFLEMEIPGNNNAAATTTPSSKPVEPQEPGSNSTTVKPNDGTAPSHPAEQTGSIGAILAAILSLTCFVACFGMLAFSPQRRNALRRLFRRGSHAVRYSRVQTAEEANLLLNTNGEFSESDDDMLL